MTGRLAVALAAGGLAIAAFSLLPRGAGEALAPTVGAVALAIAAIEALARRAGGRALDPPTTGLAIAALALALGVRRLGLPLGEELAAAVLFLALALVARRGALALRRTLGPDRFPGSLAVLPFVVYLAVLPWAQAHRPPDGDEPYNLLLAESLASDFDTDLANQYAGEAWRGFSPRPIEPQPGDPRGPRGEIWSRHNALLPLVLAPAWKVGGLAGVEIAMAAIAALAAATIASLLLRHFPGRADAVFRAWAIVAFAPPLLLYSSQVWIEVPGALAAAVALDRLAAIERGGGRRRDVALLVGALAALPLLKLRLGVVALAIVALAARPSRLPRRVFAGLVAAFVLIVATLLAWNLARFGNPLKMYDAGELLVVRQSPAELLLALVGLFFDSAFGLVAASPIWLLALPGLLLARGASPATRWTLAAALPYLLAVISRHEWYGGWSPPFRYGVVLLPFLALALAALFADRRRSGAAQRFLVAALGAATALLALVWLVAPGWTYNLADGASWWLNLLAERLGADVARFAPSSVRPRLATLLVPLAAIAAAFGLWFAPRLRARGGVRVAAVATLVAGSALLVVAAKTLPTHRVEFEDTWVEKQGGSLYPERWVVDRTRFRGAWLLYEGSSLSFRPIAGGDTARLRIASQYLRNTDSPISLSIRVDGREVARFPAERPGAWSELETPPFALAPGARISCAAIGPPGAPPANGIILDRAEISWR